jgi:tRNA dimethylallyltransferase
MANSPFHLIQIGLKRPRPELYQRIDERIDTMFANGLLKEAQILLDQGYSPDLPSMSAIGYREAIAVLNGEMNIEMAKAQMKRITRIFVRRQSNWFKDNDPNITWFDMNTDILNVVEEFIRSKLQ